MHKRVRKHSGIALATILMAITSCGGDNQAARPEQETVKVKTIKVMSAPLETSRCYPGTVEASTEVDLSFSVSGTVETIQAEAGQHVGKGQLIASLDQTSLLAAHRATQAALRQAEDAAKRMEQLHKRGSLPDIQWVEAQSGLDEARSAEELARKQLEDTRLFAPFDGYVVKRLTEVGQNVAPGIPVVRLVSRSGLEVKFSVPESEFTQINDGQRASVCVNAVGLTLGGAVTKRTPVADPVTRSYEVTVRLDKSPGSLSPGMLADVTMVNPDSGNVFTLPADAVLRDEQNHTYVWINNNGRAERRTVVIDGYAAQGVRVADGLNDGDEIIVSGQHKVSQGAAVTL